MSLGSSSTLNNIVHPTMLDNLASFYPAVANIQEANETQAADGSIVKNWVDLPNYSGLRGTLAAAMGNERRGMQLTVATATHVLDLQGYYPEILLTHRAYVWPGVEDSPLVLNIVAVKHDSHRKQTRLELEQVNH